MNTKTAVLLTTITTALAIAGCCLFNIKQPTTTNAEDITTLENKELQISNNATINDLPLNYRNLLNITPSNNQPLETNITYNINSRNLTTSYDASYIIATQQRLKVTWNNQVITNQYTCQIEMSSTQNGVGAIKIFAYGINFLTNTETYTTIASENCYWQITTGTHTENTQLINLLQTLGTLTEQSDPYTRLLAQYEELLNQYRELNQTNNQLQNQITQLQNQITTLNTTITQNESTIEQQQSTIQNLLQLVDHGPAEYVDIPGMMLTILAMPWDFISNAFNLTIFENTPYQINFSNLFKGLIAILTLLFIVKLFTNGFNALGTFANNTTDGNYKKNNNNNKPSLENKEKQEKSKE